MTTLDQAVDQLTADLAQAGWPCSEKTTTITDPPVIVLAAGTPFLAPSDAWGGQQILRLELFALYPHVAETSVLKAAGAAVADITTALDEAWVVTDTSPPFLATNVNRRPTVRLRIETLITQE